jgi:hypothetical protein
MRARPIGLLSILRDLDSRAMGLAIMNSIDIIGLIQTTLLYIAVKWILTRKKKS